MLAAHMDEVGLIISDADENGFLRFKTVGGINTDVIIGKKVLIGEKRIPGIIGLRAIHLQDRSTEFGVVSASDLYIDIGAETREEALRLIHIGDCAVFLPHYNVFGDGFIDAKAIDDRAGCAVLIRLLQKNYDGIRLCAAFTAQEEVGTRGAQAAAEFFHPALAVIAESTFCADLYPVPVGNTVTTPGAGPALTFMDGTSTSDKTLADSLIASANAHGIPLQFKRATGGGTDAGAISRSAEGIPAAVLALPCLNLHSPSSVIAESDFLNMQKLLDAWLSDGSALKI